MCAICGAKYQTYVILQWRRLRDNKTFHVCALCAERGLVNEHNVKVIQTKLYTTLASKDVTISKLSKRYPWDDVKKSNEIVSKDKALGRVILRCLRKRN
jgi:hypothetical protein